VIGMAVTRAGIPVRVWCWPRNTTDSALIRQAREDMRDWTLARVMWVADRGFSFAENRRELRRDGGHYIIGEKLRSASAEATAALSRQDTRSRDRLTPATLPQPARGQRRPRRAARSE
jgi:transposase